MPLLEYVPAGQGKHCVAPDVTLLLYVPAGHATQVLGSLAPVTLEAVPVGQGIGAEYAMQ